VRRTLFFGRDVGPFSRGSSGLFCPATRASQVKKDTIRLNFRYKIRLGEKVLHDSYPSKMSYQYQVKLDQSCTAPQVDPEKSFFWQGGARGPFLEMIVTGPSYAVNVPGTM
jgi:hypothetical protein